MAMDREIHSQSIFLAFMAAILVHLSCAYQFNVGGRDGWVVNPLENYNHWAERMRFQVNDTLFFKYNKGSNSVLVVNKEGYYQCNVNSPIIKLDDGNSIFKFDRSGPFYFISGNKTDCEEGQKIIIVVLAVRHSKNLPPPMSPAPAGHPPALAPAPALSPGGYPTPAIPTSPATSPSPSPSPSPFAATPPPHSQAPAAAPHKSPPSTGSPAPSSSSSVSTPPPQPSSGSMAPTSSNNPAANIHSAASAYTPSTVSMMFTPSIVFCLTLGAPIFL